MAIKEYYKIVLNKLEKGQYKIGSNKQFAKPKKSDIKTNELSLHALNYIIYEYLLDNKDNRYKLLYHYILIPNDVNKEGCDIDFTKVTIDDMVDFMVSVKT